MTDEQSKIFAEIHELVSRELQDSSDTRAAERLRSLLENDPQARRLYLEYTTQTASLQWWAGSFSKAAAGEQHVSEVWSTGPTEPISPAAAVVKSLPPFQPQETVSPAATRRRNRRMLGQRDWKIRGLAAVIALLAASVAWINLRSKTAPVPLVYETPATNPASQSVKTVQLEAGFTRLTLAGDVQVLIQGPAEYAIVSGTRIRLNVGRLTAVVPHSVTDFAIVTREATITDLGTEFGVEAGEQFTRAEVFDGRVSVEPRNAATSVKQILSAGQANRILPGGQMFPSESFPEMYVRVADYDVRHASETRQAAAIERWSAYSRKLRRDPDLLAYYTFDNESEFPDKLINRAAATVGEHDGYNTNTTWTQGHLPGRRGLAFNGKDSFVHIDIPEQSSQMTLATWVRIDSWTNDYTCLLMSDDWNRPGEIHWEFFPDHHLEFGAFHVQRQSFTLGSPSRTSANGQWVHLAGTLNATTGTIALYRNGVMENSGTSSGAALMSIGSARIGHWDHATAAEPDAIINRWLCGRVDELAIFKRALTANEIQEMFQSEKGGE